MGHYTPSKVQTITKVYVGHSPQCGAHHCSTNISPRLPCLQVSVTEDDKVVTTLVHDRCLGRHLLDTVLQNESDYIEGSVHEVIISSN